MKQIVEIPALGEYISSKEMEETALRLSVTDGQIRIEIPEWETRFELPAEHLTQALETLLPAPQQSPVTLTLVQHIGQKVSKLEQILDAQPHHTKQLGLDLEAVKDNLAAIHAQFTARIEAAEGRIEASGATVAGMGERLDRFGQELHEGGLIAHLMQKQIDAIKAHLTSPTPDSPDDSAAALYGGEQ